MRAAVIASLLALAPAASADCLDTATNDCDGDGLSVAQGDCDDEDETVGECDNPLADATLTGGESCSTGGASTFIVLLPLLAFGRRTSRGVR